MFLFLFLILLRLFFKMCIFAFYTSLNSTDHISLNGITVLATVWRTQRTVSAAAYLVKHTGTVLCKLEPNAGLRCAPQSRTTSLTIAVARNFQRFNFPPVCSPSDFPIPNYFCNTWVYFASSFASNSTICLPWFSAFLSYSQSCFFYLPIYQKAPRSSFYSECFRASWSSLYFTYRPLNVLLFWPQVASSSLTVQSTFPSSWKNSPITFPIPKQRSLCSQRLSFFTSMLSKALKQLYPTDLSFRWTILHQALWFWMLSHSAVYSIKRSNVEEERFRMEELYWLRQWANITYCLEWSLTFHTCTYPLSSTYY